MDGKVIAIARYPMKGMSGEALDKATLAPGTGVPGDRRFAILRPGARADLDGFTPKSAFFQLARDPKLATLSVAWEDDSAHLQISRNGRPVARGQPLNPVGRALLEQFFSAFLGAVGGAPKIAARADADGGKGFWDVAEPLVSIINATSLNELARAGEAPAAAERFRGNLLVDLGEPWAEDAWVGAQFKIGGVTFEGVEAVTRCAATNVAPTGDPQAGVRDRNYPRLLDAAFARETFGVYARVISEGDILSGQAFAN